MKKINFLPRRFYSTGLGIALIGLGWDVYRAVGFGIVNDPYAWLASSIAVIGFLLVMFTREKVEDEFIDQLRLRAFLLSIIFTCIYYVGWNIMAFMLDFRATGSASTSITFLQAFYICYFAWLKKKFQFTSKNNNA